MLRIMNLPVLTISSFTVLELSWTTDPQTQDLSLPLFVGEYHQRGGLTHGAWLHSSHHSGDALEAEVLATTLS